MNDTTWRKIFLVVTRGTRSELEVVELEGHPIEGEPWGGGDWAVNTRSPGCGSKLIEVVPAICVHETREAAEKHLGKLIERRAAEKKEG